MHLTREFVYSYQNMVTTDLAVNRHYLLLRCLPYVNDFQDVVESHCLSLGFDEFKKGQDSFGNAICYGGRLSPHRSLSWQSLGIVRQSPYRIASDSSDFIYLYRSALCESTDALKIFASTLSCPDDPYDRALYLTGTVFNTLQYRKCVTDVKTTASEALALGSGVCQDFAHVLIALCRMFHLPARYVNGLIAGDGETHAWVEILIKNRWYGFDPTHNKKIEYGYIKLSHGRDASDCPVCRGVFTGQATQQMSVHVLVGEL